MAIEANTPNDWGMRGATNTTLPQFQGVPRQLVVNIDDGYRPVIMDGTTLGGKFKCASSDELSSGLSTKLDKTEKAESAKSADNVLWSNIQNVPNNVSNAVSYTSQMLTDEQKEQLVKNLGGTFLPLSGGTITGGIASTASGVIRQATSDNHSLIMGGIGLTDGAYLAVFGKDWVDDRKGGFSIVTTDPNKTLSGNPDGRLLWQEQEIEAVASYGTGYIRYKSGLQICWGSLATESNGGKNLVFPAPFAVEPIVNGIIGADMAAAGNSYSSVFPEMRHSGTNCNLWARYNNKLFANAFILWIAIGVWK